MTSSRTQPLKHLNFEQINLEKILFIDIETVGEAEDFSQLSPRSQELWKKKAVSLAHQNKYKENPSADAAYIYRQESGIHSEFAKIVCISVGVLLPQQNQPSPTYSFTATSFYGDNEQESLRYFHRVLKSYPDYYLAAHNGFNFDFSFICRRSVIHQLSLPFQLRILQKKPWNTYWLLDTMDLWKFMGLKNYSSLDTLAHVLNFPSPKKSALATKSSTETSSETSTETSTDTSTDTSIDGSMIHDLFYQKKDFKNIYTYCEHDCLAVAQAILRLRELPIVKPENFHSKPYETLFQNSSPE